MKKLILLVIFLPFLQANAQTSVYHPFPDSNAVWNFEYHAAQCQFGIMLAYYSIHITGDTIINNTTYSKLFTPGISLSPGSINCNYLPTGYRGALRQDIPNRKVYFISPFSSSETLYFDFNWEVGDTVFGKLMNISIDTIFAIDSVLVGNSYRKRWRFNKCDTINVIEGIGSSYELLFSPGCLTDQPYYNLMCFKQNGQTLYPDTSSICELITVSVNDLENELNELEIFPNPVSDELIISFIIEKTADMELKLYNSLGLEVKIISKKIFKGKNKITLPVKDFPSGIYFLKTSVNENQLTRKIIKY